VFDYIELDEEYSIYEIPPLDEWLGHSIQEINIRKRYGISILGIKKGEEMNILPSIDYIFTKDEHLMVLGSQKDVEAVLKKIR
jgi:trk system potassium uptake protein TrkA